MGYVLWVMCSRNKGAVGLCAVPLRKFALQEVQGYSATCVMCSGNKGAVGFCAVQICKFAL